ncbi:CPCC family cysteine-rich protein [Streptomyces sp. NPDC102406]|uniref:CPCC family cysteine-rich protein n=1 Tax=Streptomyces sp. NPDC102406 TaxID=3366171 RepID=UPI00382D8033
MPLLWSSRPRRPGRGPGSHAICPICCWEDDPTQFRRPFMPGGADRVPLVEAQRHFQEFGACDQRGRLVARPPADDEPSPRA